MCLRLTLIIVYFQVINVIAKEIMVLESFMTRTTVYGKGICKTLVGMMSLLTHTDNPF